MRTTTRRGTGEQGLAVIMTGLLLIPLMTFAAFGVDLASWYSRISQIQKAADAAALAGTVWMPSLSKATTEAEASLRSNGFRDGVDGIVVEIDRGATPTSLRVEVTDTDADRVFSQVFRGQQSLTRHAEAEYNLPIPLGSPLNYFGGVTSKTQPPQSFEYSVNWPGDYQTRPPVNRPCNMGTFSGQGLGRWPATGDFDPGGFSSSNPQCLFGTSGEVITGPGSGNSQVPPADYSTRVPNNGVNNSGCRAREDGSGAVVGRWRNSTFSGGGGGASPCSWPNWRTNPASIPPDATTRLPSNQPCRVGYETSGPGGGFWNGTYFTSPTSAAVGGSTAAGNKLCQWAVGITETDNTPPNPIDAGRSPNFWAQIHGPGGNQASGDAYSTRCTSSTNCGTPDNPLYTDASDPNQGYWYVVKIPPGGGGSTAIRIFDAQVTPGALDVGTGDSVIAGSNMSFSTDYRVYRQTNPLDFNARTPLTTGAANQTPGSCNWSIQQQPEFQLQWANLCTVNAVAGDIYLVNVRTSTIDGVANSAGRNGYAVEACSGGTCTGAGQPALYAYDKMVLYNNISSGDATFYVAEVGPQYAGKTLVLELFDPGESSGTAWMYPQRPSPTATGANVPVAPADCDFQSTRSGYPRASDLNNGGACSVRTAAPGDGGTLFNGHWVTMRVSIPPDYTCQPGINPETDPNSCWWGIRYSFSGGGQPTDTTTWQARIEGNPLQLTQ